MSAQSIPVEGSSHLGATFRIVGLAPKSKPKGDGQGRQVTSNTRPRLEVCANTAMRPSVFVVNKMLKQLVPLEPILFCVFEYTITGHLSKENSEVILGRFMRNSYLCRREAATEIQPVA